MQKTKIQLDTKSTAGAAIVKELFELPVGTTVGTVEVSFDFVAEKSADEEYTAVQELCPWTLVAILMSKINGVTQDAVIGCIEDILAMDEKQRKALREGLKATTTARLEEMGAFVKKTRSGKTRVEVIGDADIASRTS